MKRALAISKIKDPELFFFSTLRARIDAREIVFAVWNEIRSISARILV
jgi:hypothetical protein